MASDGPTVVKVRLQPRIENVKLSQKLQFIQYLRFKTHQIAAVKMIFPLMLDKSATNLRVYSAV